MGRAYEIGLLRPLGNIVRSTAPHMAFREPTDDADRVHPVYAWSDLAGFVHLVCASRRGPTVLSLWAGDLKSVLAASEFTPLQLTPDPTAYAGDIEFLRRKGLLPESWEVSDDPPVVD